MGNKQTSLDQETLEMLQKKTRMSPRELKDWNKRFRKQFPDGKMSRRQFAAVYSDFFPGGHSDAFADIVFNSFDANGDGAVNFTEFTCALGIINNGSVDEKINWAFDLYDQDKNGVITMNELVTMLKVSIFLALSLLIPSGSVYDPKLIRFGVNFITYATVIRS